MGRDDAVSMPAEPLTEVQESAVAVVALYKLLRQAGMPVLGAACYLAATARLNGEDPQQPG